MGDECMRDETVGWHHWFKGCELGQILGDGDGQGSLACYNPWDLKQSDVTWWLKNNRNIWERGHHLLKLVLGGFSNIIIRTTDS